MTGQVGGRKEGRTGEEESDETSLRRGEGDLEEVDMEGESIFCTVSDKFDPTLLLTPFNRFNLIHLQRFPSKQSTSTM